MLSSNIGVGARANPDKKIQLQMKFPEMTQDVRFIHLKFAPIPDSAERSNFKSSHLIFTNLSQSHFPFFSICNISLTMIRLQLPVVGPFIVIFHLRNECFQLQPHWVYHQIFIKQMFPAKQIQCFIVKRAKKGELSG